MIKEIAIVCLLVFNVFSGCAYFIAHRSLNMIIDWEDLDISETPQGVMKEGSHYCVVFDSENEYTENHEICHEMVYRDREHFCGGN